MPTFTITYRDGSTEDVIGDQCEVEAGGSVVVFAYVTLMGQPRRIVARRITAGATVAAVDASGDAPTSA